MLADLERLIQLQRLEDLAEKARRTVADEPLRQQDLDAKLAAGQQALEAQRGQLAASQAARREIEKDLAAVQSRLSKFKDQLMAVKTNREYQAMQKEMEVANEEIRRLEDRLLERMLEQDDLAARAKQAERDSAEERAAIEEERRALARDVADARATQERLVTEREALVAQIPAPLMTVFDRVMRHHKLAAVAEVVDGRCSICNVRLRPQMYNEVRRNDQIFQCESCHRFLYYAAPPGDPQP